MAASRSVARTSKYEAEPAQRVVVGSITVTPDVWWSGDLTVPDESGLAFIALTRHGPASRSDSLVAAIVPLPELSAFGTLVAKLIAAAQR